MRVRADGSIKSAARSMWVGAQVGGRVILLICESCQRPLEDESLSGRVTYSDNTHTWRVGFKFRVGGGVGCHGVLQGAFVSGDLLMNLNWETNYSGHQNQLNHKKQIQSIIYKINI